VAEAGWIYRPFFFPSPLPWRILFFFHFRGRDYHDLSFSRARFYFPISCQRMLFLSTAFIFPRASRAFFFSFFLFAGLFSFYLGPVSPLNSGLGISGYPIDKILGERFNVPFLPPPSQLPPPPFVVLGTLPRPPEGLSLKERLP